MSLEKDITQVKKLLEQDELFKPATPENLAKRREAEVRARLEREEKRQKSMNDPKKIEARLSYQRFKNLLNVINTGDKAAILLKVYELMDNYYAFKSQRSSDYALNSLNYLIRKEGLR